MSCGIAERERVGATRRCLRRVAQRGIDRPRPLVVLVSLPDGHDQARHVEVGTVEVMHLGIAQLVSGVIEPLVRRELKGPLELD